MWRRRIILVFGVFIVIVSSGRSPPEIGNTWPHSLQQSYIRPWYNTTRVAVTARWGFQGNAQEFSVALRDPTAPWSYATSEGDDAWLDHDVILDVVTASLPVNGLISVELQYVDQYLYAFPVNFIDVSWKSEEGYDVYVEETCEPTCNGCLNITTSRGRARADMYYGHLRPNTLRTRSNNTLSWRNESHPWLYTDADRTERGLSKVALEVTIVCGASPCRRATINVELIEKEYSRHFEQVRAFNHFFQWLSTSFYSIFFCLALRGGVISTLLYWFRPTRHWGESCFVFTVACPLWILALGLAYDISMWLGVGPLYSLAGVCVIIALLCTFALIDSPIVRDHETELTLFVMVVAITFLVYPWMLERGLNRAIAAIATLLAVVCLWKANIALQRWRAGRFQQPALPVHNAPVHARPHRSVLFPG